MLNLWTYKDFDSLLAAYELSSDDLKSEDYTCLSEKYDKHVELERQYISESSIMPVMYSDQTICIPNPAKDYLNQRLFQLEQEIGLMLIAVKANKEQGMHR